MPQPHRSLDHRATRTALTLWPTRNRIAFTLRTPKAVETVPDSTLDNKNQNRYRVKKSPLQNLNELRRFGAQTRDRIGLESKLPTPDPSPNKLGALPGIIATQTLATMAARARAVASMSQGLPTQATAWWRAARCHHHRRNSRRCQSFTGDRYHRHQALVEPPPHRTLPGTRFHRDMWANWIPFIA
jgi:hypothetical protein